MPSPIKAIAATPPTTPPTIAPIGGALDGSIVEPVGTMTRVVVTTCPEGFVVTYCEENIEETSLVTTELEVGGTVAIGWVEAVDREDWELCELCDELDWVDAVDAVEAEEAEDELAVLLVESGSETVESVACFLINEAALL